MVEIKRRRIFFCLRLPERKLEEVGRKTERNRKSDGQFSGHPTLLFSPSIVRNTVEKVSFTNPSRTINSFSDFTRRKITPPRNRESGRGQTFGFRMSVNIDINLKPFRDGETGLTSLASDLLPWPKSTFLGI